MYKFFVLLLINFLFLAEMAGAQGVVKQPDGGGDYRDLLQIHDELSPRQRVAIIVMLTKNEAVLRKAGKIQLSSKPLVTAFEWPLKQALGFNDYGFYGISNYVDENPVFPNAVTDYNCGTRSYDQASGYNHRGTDIFTWPFYWQKMQRNAVEIIAAAPGTIIGKTDGNFDQNCSFCPGACDWNAVYVMHADGSVAWYGHMKAGSLTSKIVGQTVATGEYLGVVGSSGNSTGPHLHFEVYTNSSYTQLVDPWAGPCNTLNGTTSWWANQQPYYVSTLNKIATHGAPPNMTSCPAGDATNEKINFADGQQIYLGGYYRDQQPGQQAFHTLYRPDGSIYTNWTQDFTTYFSASWWYFFLPLPNPAPTGTWRYQVQYNGRTTSVNFAVNSTAVTICPGSINPIFSNLSGSTYQWQENSGSGFVNISDNSLYGGTATNQLQLKNIPSSYYGYQYRCVVNGGSFSHTISLKFVSTWVGYKNNTWEDPANWSCGNIPDANTDVIVNTNATVFPEVNANTSCRTLTTSPGATVTVKTGVSLTITH